MFERLKTLIFSQRAVNLGFLCVTVAAMLGCPAIWVLGLSAVLFAVLIWIG